MLSALLARSKQNHVSSAVQYAAARFAGDSAYARSPTIALGGSNPLGATNFEVQALVYIEGAYTTDDTILSVQFPAGRNAGLFVSNLYIAPGDPALVVGDSQVGTVGGGFDGLVDVTGKWCLMTFSADGTAAPTGLWRATLQSLDGTVGFTTGGRTKGVENSLQGNRVDLNGGGVDSGWPNGLRFAEVRAYNAQRSDAQRQLDLTNTDPTGAVFWWRFADNGSGGVTATDISGNALTPTLVSATLATGPLF